MSGGVPTGLPSGGATGYPSFTLHYHRTGGRRACQHRVLRARCGIVSRRKDGRAFIYAPAVTRDVIRRLALKQFLDSYFDSSENQLLKFLRDELQVAPGIVACAS